MTEATVLAWLKRAAHQAEAINYHLLRHLPVTEVQLDEMWSFIARKHAGRRTRQVKAARRRGWAAMGLDQLCS